MPTKILVPLEFLFFLRTPPEVPVQLRCKLPGKLHRVTGPLAHHVVLNHTFELLINTTMLF